MTSQFRFSHLFHLVLCLDPCGKRGIKWSRQPGFAILGPANRTKSANTRTECRLLCLKETQFLCRSFQFLPAAGLCYLFSLTSLQGEDNFVRLPGYVFEEWACQTGLCCLFIHACTLRSRTLL